VGAVLTEIPIVVVCRNGLGLSKKALRSAMNQDIPVTVLVVDNASSDGTSAWLATKDIAVISTGQQWALAKCWNVALKSLWRAGYNKALVVNNDVLLRSDTAGILDAIGGEFVTCVSVSSEDQLGIPGDRDTDTLRLNARTHPDFSCWLIRKSVTDRNLWFDESYFPAYGEDCAYHLAMHRAGIKAVCVDLPFIHFGASTLKNADAGEANRIRRGADANRERFRKAYGCLPGTPAYEALFNSPR